MPCPDVGTRSFKLCRCGCRWRCQCLRFRTRVPGPPFGASSKLGTVIGLHPKLVSLPPESPPVGTYDPPIRKSKCTVPSWEKEEKMTEFAVTMGGHIPAKYIRQRKLTTIGRGPGTHDIIRWPDVSDIQNEMIKRDIGFSTSSRFRSVFKSTTPGPGYTPKFHNPYHYMEQNRFKGLSKLPTFEFDGLVPRFRGTCTFSLPCNMYNVKYPNSLEGTLNKVVGKRGPYDLFTGPRDSSTLVGHMARGKRMETKGWPFAVQSEIDKLLNKSNYFKGRWSNCPRFVKKPALRMLMNQPGPGHYDPKLPAKPKNAKQYPFDSCVEYARPIPPERLQPGPGRYRWRERRRIKGNGWTHVFRSTVPRTIAAFIPKTYNSF